MNDPVNLIGKHLLIGVTYLDHRQEFVGQIQIHGPIIRCDKKNGIVIQRSDGEGEFNLPPDFKSIESAKPGEYRLRSTGEIVVDPDYITSWTATLPAPNEKHGT